MIIVTAKASFISSIPVGGFLLLPKLILASQSPRRKQLIEALGLPFSVRVPGTDEAEPGVADVGDGVTGNALLKAATVAKTATGANDIVIGADTLVVLADRVLAKPSGPEEVVTMLSALSGKAHTVITGMALCSRQWGERISTTESKVIFRKITPQEMADYAATAEPYDKAGAYAVQGLGALFIERIEGSYTNVMGFPIEKFLTELVAYTGIPAPQWFAPRVGK